MFIVTEELPNSNERIDAQNSDFVPAKNWNEGFLNVNMDAIDARMYADDKDDDGNGEIS